MNQLGAVGHEPATVDAWAAADSSTRLPNPDSDRSSVSIAIDAVYGTRYGSSLEP